MSESVLEKLMRLLMAALVIACLCAVASAQEYRPNDPTYDNAPAFQADAADCSVKLPPGDLYFKTPIATPYAMGGKVEGEGLSYRVRNGYRRKGLATKLIYVGPGQDEQGNPIAFLTVPGGFWRVTEVTLQRGVQYGDTFTPQWKTEKGDKCVALRIPGSQSGELMSGKIHDASLSILGFDCGIEFCGPRMKHADQCQFDFVWSEDNREFLRCSNPDACSHVFSYLRVGGHCETAFNYERGGFLSVQQMNLDSAALVLRVRDASPNQWEYTIHQLRVDQQASGWRIAENLTTYDCIRVVINGTVGGRIGETKLGANPLVGFEQTGGAGIFVNGLRQQGVPLVVK